MVERVVRMPGRRGTRSFASREEANRKEELRRFKTEIDLVRFAGTFGYDLTRAERSGSYVRLRRGRGDQIIITREQDGTFVWVNPTNCEPRSSRPGTSSAAGSPRSLEQGTIIDFIQRERPDLAGNLGEIRKLLRVEVGSRSPTSVRQIADPVLKTPEGHLQPHSKFDRDRVLRDYESARFIEVSEYLLSRGLKAEIQMSTRFAGAFRVRVASKEVLFPHRDLEGIIGFERKHPSYTLFSTGGRRGPWHSVRFPTDQVLVVAESAIDCMSYQQLHPRDNARYVSTGGTLSSSQIDLLAVAIREVPQDGLVVVATDDDFQNPLNPGRKLALRIRQLTLEIRPSLQCITPLPYGEKDWNDVVRKRD